MTSKLVQKLDLGLTCCKASGILEQMHLGGMGCSETTSSNDRLHGGEWDGGEGDDPGGRRRGGLLTARGDHLLHGDHEMPTMCKTLSCMRAERKHAKNKNNMNRTIST